MAAELGAAEVPKRSVDLWAKNQAWEVVIDPYPVQLPVRLKVQPETKREITASRAELHQSRQSSET